MAQGTVGIAVLGAGRIGAMHALHVAQGVPGAALIGVADVLVESARRAVDAAGTGRAVADYHDLLGDPAVCGVIVATPTDTHPQLMADAARAGKHILCEKPIAQTLEQTRAAIAAVRQAGVLVQIGFQRRFDRAFAGAHQSIRRGDIGEPWTIRLVGRDPRLAPLAYLAVSGGQFKDQAIHEYDLARWLMGREVEEVYATGSVLVDPAVAGIGDVDTALTTLRYEGGALGVVESARRAVYGYDVRAEVLGSEGKLLIGRENRTAATLLQPNRVSRDHVDWFVELFADAYRDEVAYFVDCMRTGRSPEPGPEDGYRALHIAVAATRSHREHRPVRLDEIKEG